ncbi:TonB family protein [Pedobacter fastidiosus]|uniref:TonB family protein n=1 Tax=Pedobacter fastidiosus TaxID=2765361 RepID=A0ABR7KPP4_9SPHI|nr:energy transducer TonB [Pedobacter fastidiosus]MBC6110050.1 TonB family protein [Pedobacter fastidiosus]
MKLRFLTTVLFALCLSVQAQKKQNIYYLKDNGKEVLDQKEADLIRVIQEPDSGDTRFKLIEFFKNGKKKSQGYVSAFEPRLIFEGPVLSFDSTGRRTQIMNYDKGVLSGTSIFYHSNGKEKRRAEYIKNTPIDNQMIGISSSLNEFIFNTNSKIIYDADSNGVANIVDGNGHLKEITKYKDDELVEEGDYVNGFKQGIWTGKFSKNTDTYKETYDANKLISGESTKEGKTYSYTTNMEAPEFPGGQKAWNNYLGSATKYPADAQKAGVRGKVMAIFVVDQKGNLVDIKIISSVYPSIDEEARRVLSSAPRWKPAKQKGIPVRVKYNQNINFNF